MQYYRQLVAGVVEPLLAPIFPTFTWPPSSVTASPFGTFAGGVFPAVQTGTSPQNWLAFAGHSRSQPCPGQCSPVPKLSFAMCSRKSGAVIESLSSGRIHIRPASINLVQEPLGKSYLPHRSYMHSRRRHSWKCQPHSGPRLDWFGSHREPA